MFPRYGSFPGFNPIVELSMTFHTAVVGANGQRQAMFIERTPGLAEVSSTTCVRADELFGFGGPRVLSWPGSRAQALRPPRAPPGAVTSAEDVVW